MLVTRWRDDVAIIPSPVNSLGDVLTPVGNPNPNDDITNNFSQWFKTSVKLVSGQVFFKSENVWKYLALWMASGGVCLPVT